MGLNNCIITVTGKARVCFVNVPENANCFKVSAINYRQFLGYGVDTKYLHDWTSLPPGEWQLLSRLSQVIEEQAAGIFEGSECHGTILYRNPYLPPFEPSSQPTKILMQLARSLNILEDQDPVVLVEFKK